VEFGRAIEHKIIIEPTSNKGFYVRVGCGRFSFSNNEDLLQGLRDYLVNPEKLEKEYNRLQSQLEEVAREPVEDPPITVT